MENNKQDILLAEIKKDIEYIKNFINQADKRYASKLSEKIVYGLVGMILITVAAAVIAGVVKAAEFAINKL